jgi:hypothetical protein
VSAKWKAGIVISDAEVNNFLANPENVVGQEEYNLAHILFRAPEGASPEQLATPARQGRGRGRPGRPAAKPSTSWLPAIPMHRTHFQAAISAGAAPSACRACLPKRSPASSQARQRPS